jgi:hypothetical protein
MLALSGFRSDVNFLKRAVVGSAKLASPSISMFSGTRFVTNYTVPHGLPYTPIFQVFYRPFTDGIVWPPISSRNTGNQLNPADSTYGPGLLSWVDSTNLNLQLFYDSNSLGRTTEVFWIIYGDFKLP